MVPNPEIKKIVDAMENVIENTNIRGFSKFIALTVEGFLKVCELNSVGNIYKYHDNGYTMFFMSQIQK